MAPFPQSPGAPRGGCWFVHGPGGRPRPSDQQRLVASPGGPHAYPAGGEGRVGGPRGHHVAVRPARRGRHPALGPPVPPPGGAAAHGAGGRGAAAAYRVPWVTFQRLVSGRSNWLRGEVGATTEAEGMGRRLSTRGGHVCRSSFGSGVKEPSAELARGPLKSRMQMGWGAAACSGLCGLLLSNRY